MVGIVIKESIEKFIKLEASAGILLIVASALAIIFANSPLQHIYHELLEQPVALTIGPLSVEKHLSHFINDGLMAVFFLLVSLEIKREVIEGHLSNRDQQILPVVGAIGGVLFPSLIYAYFNHDFIYHDTHTISGWAIPAATDIAFALGVISLLGSRVPPSLKIFLAALAIIDDLAAIIIIALFYSANLSVVSLLLAAVLILLLIILNLNRVTKKAAYFVIGFFLWFCVLKSGIHATLAGVIIGLTIPLRVVDENSKSPLRSLEHSLHPWVAYLILPIFAFANAGVDLSNLSMADFTNKVPLGIICGLFIGKQLGVFVTIKALVGLGFAKMPKGANWGHIYGVSVLTGIGFTMSIFIGNLAFPSHPEITNVARLGILVGSVLSAVVGYTVLSLVSKKEQKK